MQANFTGSFDQYLIRVDFDMIYNDPGINSQRICHRQLCNTVIQ